MQHFDVNVIRRDFATLAQQVKGKPLIYLDNAATTHKPDGVLQAMKDYYQRCNANPHRGAYELGVTSTTLYEGARARVSQFINAASPREIVFTKNATEALNLIAFSYGMSFVGPGDEIVLCISEHHSNLVPWQRVAKTRKAVLKYLYLNKDYTLDMDQLAATITEKTKVVSIAHMSNALGTIYPIEEIIDFAHAKGAVVVIDGAQSVPHSKVDVQQLDADFLVWSGHKMLSPMGIGVLYGKLSLLEQIPPFLFGGEMIEYVQEQESTFAEPPLKFEGGTPNVAGALGLAAAIDYLEAIGWENIQSHERRLTAYALEQLRRINHLRIIGPGDVEKQGPVISFVLEGCHPHDVATILDSYGVAVRAGHHCAQPLMSYLQVPATSRASFYLYNTLDEVDSLIAAIKEVRKWLGYGP
ncbi:MAG: cysteine desulfurase [Firmicutes bacterium]|nr:cysteine desulfurase [Bacillota bacterium]